MGVCLIDKSCTMVASVEERNTTEEIANSDAMIAKIIRLLQVVTDKCEGGTRLVAFGVGCPGQAKDGVLIAASSFPLWKNVPYVDILKAKLNVPVTLLNGV